MEQANDQIVPHVKEWVLQDPDEMQYCMQLGEKVYSFRQPSTSSGITSEGEAEKLWTDGSWEGAVIDMGSYSLDHLIEVAKAYYEKSEIDEIVQSGDWYLLAECEYETNFAPLRG